MILSKQLTLQYDQGLISLDDYLRRSYGLGNIASSVAESHVGSLLSSRKWFPYMQIMPELSIDISQIN